LKKRTKKGDGKIKTKNKNPKAKLQSKNLLANNYKSRIQYNGWLSRSLAAASHHNFRILGVQSPYDGGSRAKATVAAQGFRRFARNQFYTLMWQNFRKLACIPQKPQAAM